MQHSKIVLAAVIGLMTTASAWADIKVGVVLSTTGPAASLGIPEKKTVELFPKEIAGQKVEYIFQDDRSDPTEAVKVTKKLIDEDKVDVVIGASTTPSSLAMINVVGEAKVPNVSIASGRNVVFPVEGNRKWVVNSVQTTGLMARRTIQYMLQSKIKTVGFIGFDNALGEDWWNNFSKDAKSAGIDIVANERFDPTATSVTGQILHIMAAKPQAVLIAASGTPAALPERGFKQVGYKGQIFQTHGVANPDFLRVCGADCNGTILSVSPGVVAAQLPADSPIKQSTMKYAQTYEGAYGRNTLSQFSAGAWDVGVLLEHAIPIALKKAQPSNLVEFRAALRDALEGLKDIAGAQGIYNMSPSNHNGLDDRAVVMVKIENHSWKLLK